MAEYQHYRTDGGLVIRMPVSGEELLTEVLTDGDWVPVDPADYGGDTNPWASQVGDGNATQLTPAEVRELPA